MLGRPETPRTGELVPKLPLAGDKTNNCSVRALAEDARRKVSQALAGRDTNGERNEQEHIYFKLIETEAGFRARLSNTRKQLVMWTKDHATKDAVVLVFDEIRKKPERGDADLRRVDHLAGASGWSRPAALRPRV